MEYEDREKDSTAALRVTIFIGSLILGGAVWAAGAALSEDLKLENQQLLYELRDAESQRDRVQRELDQIKREFEIYQDGVKDSR